MSSVTVLIFNIRYHQHLNLNFGENNTVTMNRNCPKILAIVGSVFFFVGIFCALYGFPKLIEQGISKVKCI